MKTISLTKGKATIVDDEDFEYLSQWKWHIHGGYGGRQGYASRCLYLGGGAKNPKRKTLHMHALLIDVPEGMLADHKNGNTLDNRRSNLRLAIPAENQHNKGIRRHNKSGYKGVSWDADNKKWVAQISLNYKKIHIGYFKDKVAAAKAYDRKAIELQGRFARINGI